MYEQQEYTPGNIPHASLACIFVNCLSFNGQSLAWPKVMVSKHRRTVNIHVGRKLFGKSRDEILEEIVKKIDRLRILAVQQFPDIIRVTFDSEDTALKVLNFVLNFRLYDMWCRMDGGPLQPAIVHFSDYPYEEDVVAIDALFKTFGKV